MTTVTQQFKDTVNTMVGRIVDSSLFDIPKTRSNLHLGIMGKNGFAEKVAWGKYRIIKKVIQNSSISRVSKPELYQEIIDKYSGSNPNKEVTENLCLSVASQYIQNKNCLILSGPDYGSHCEELFDSGIASFLYVTEREKGIYDVIMDEANNCSYYQEGLVQIDNNDLTDRIYTDCHYLHLDMFGTYKNVIPVIELYLNEQKKLDEYKCIYFAIARRQSGTSDVLFHNVQGLLSSFFGSSLIGVNNKLDGIGKDSIDLAAVKSYGNFCRQYIPMFENTGNIVDIKWIAYGDGTPMSAFQIIYI